MHPDLAKLIDLQSCDNESKRLREDSAFAARQVSDLEARVKFASAELSSVAELIAKEEALRRREESEIADLRQKAERARKKVEFATNAAQLTALEHELGFASSEISRLEDAELESMERSDRLEDQRSSAAGILSDANTALDRERARCAEVTAQNRQALDQLESRRSSLRAEIAQSPTGDNSLSMYDRITRAKGTAVAQAVDHKCAACQMLIRPQRWNDIADNSPDSPSAETLMTCENCGRLLYYDPARDAPRKSPQSQATPERNESIAAQIVRSNI